MPTPNPRVHVTLSPSTDALVTRMAQLTRVSKSQVLRELLEAAEPGLQRAAALMEAAQGAAQAVRTRLRDGLDDSIGKAERQLAGILADQDQLVADLVAQAEAVRGRRPARDARLRAPGSAEGRARDPLPSNRGVKSPGEGKPQAARKGRR